MFRATPPSLFDIAVNTGGTKVTIKVSKSQVILDLSLKRVTIEQLDMMIQEDWERWLRFRNEQSKGSPLFRTSQEVYVPEVSSHPRFLGGQPALFSPEAVLPSETESLEYKEIVRNSIKKFANAQLLQEDEHINVMDCVQLVTYMNNLKCEIRHGVSIGMLGTGFGCVLARKGVDMSQ